MYDYYLGGKTNYSVDREAAKRVTSACPAIGTVARVNRAYMHRAIRLVAEQGISQFIDLGTGIPTTPNLHEIAQEVAPASRVVYVDHDPIVLVYADELLDSTAQGATDYVEADATDLDAVLTAVEGSCVDLDRPVCLSLHALLHFVPGARAYEMVNSLVERLAPGSYLSLSHCTADFDPEAWEAVVDIYKGAGTQVQMRTRSEVEAFFGGLDLVDPGVAVAHRWRPAPASGPSLVSDAMVSLYAGVAIKT